MIQALLTYSWSSLVDGYEDSYRPNLDIVLQEEWQIFLLSIKNTTAYQLG